MHAYHDWLLSWPSAAWCSVLYVRWRKYFLWSSAWTLKPKETCLRWISKPNKLENVKCRKWWLQKHFRSTFHWDVGLNFRLLHGCQNYHSSYKLPKAKCGDRCEVDSIITIHIDGKPSPRGFIWHEDGGVYTCPSGHEVCIWPFWCNCVLRIL